jgi:hypothetical protein
MANVTINNSRANPDPAPISKGADPSNKTLQFQTSDSVTYRVSGFSDALTGGPDPVDISRGNPSVDYTAVQTASGNFSYSFTVVTSEYETPGEAVATSESEAPGQGAAQIQVDP